MQMNCGNLDRDNLVSVKVFYIVRAGRTFKVNVLRVEVLELLQL